jgi:hypothetical protein
MFDRNKISSSLDSYWCYSVSWAKHFRSSWLNAEIISKKSTKVNKKQIQQSKNKLWFYAVLHTRFHFLRTQHFNYFSRFLASRSDPAARVRWTRSRRLPATEKSSSGTSGPSRSKCKVSNFKKVRKTDHRKHVLSFTTDFE